MATLPHHLHMINNYSPASPDVTFTIFPRLPTELRLQVWKWSVAKQRLIRIEIHHQEETARLPGILGVSRNSDGESRGEDPSSPSEDDSSSPSPRPPSPPAPYTSTNALGKTISKRRYVATVRSCFQLHSKLLRVSREARQAALEFYRIHIPCNFPKGDAIGRFISYGSAREMQPHETATAPLYLNPEYDILHLQIMRPAEHTFVDFLHDLKAYDPRDVGLLRLALDPNSITPIHEALLGSTYRDRAILPSTAEASLVSTLTNLRDMIWMIQGHVGRPIIGPLLDFPQAGVRFNHSMPLMSLAPSFDLHERDPRDKDQVEKDLQYVLAWRDPRGMRVQWRDILESWGVHREHNPVRERVLFAHEPETYRPCVYNVETANQYLREEDQSWARSQVERKLYFTRYATIPVETDAELERVSRPALGFWLFPAEAVGPLEGTLDRWKMTFDMRGHWPELALARMI